MEATLPSGIVRIWCVCGGEIEFEPRVLGRIIPCRHCGRYLRPALQFVLVDTSLAPNVTAQCTCGHFIVDDPGKAGKRSRCKVCRTHLMMPEPAVRYGVEQVVRVPRRVLQKQMKRSQIGRQRVPKDMSRLRSAAHAGRISLGPGEHICTNEECGALLGVRANVCPKCGTNRLTGERYDGVGPSSDPRGNWPNS